MDSLWSKTFNQTKDFPQISANIDCDVYIIGGGIFGITCAYYLTKQGFKVVVLEKDKIASKTTGNTTAKITSQHGLFYKHLIDDYGHTFAKKYLDANEAAIQNIKNIIDTEKISCDFSYQNSYIYATTPEELQNIHDEVTAVRSLNFPCEFAATVGLPFNTLGSICFKKQAQFHPLKYVYGLCDSISDKAKIYTHTTATDIRHDTKNYVVSCYANVNSKNNNLKYQVRSKYVILASHYPFINIPGFYFTKMYQSTSYLIAVDTKKSLFKGMYISAKNPVFSFRTAKYASNMPNLYIGTGFKKWGMTLSNIAANIVVDMINGKENEYSNIFSSTRLHPIKNGDEFKNMIVQSTKSLIVDKVKKSYLQFDDISPNSGGIVEINGDKVGIFKDSKNKIFAVKPFCSHLGCLLSWNNVDKTWDCPCHGSRFDYMGKNLYDPAFKDLDRYNV